MNAKFSAKCVALIAAGAMSMSLAACSGGSMDDSSSSNGSAANSDTITLGSVTTNSGTAAAYGEAEVAGFKLAVDEINAKGGINGKKARVQSFSYHMGGAIFRTPKFWKQEREMHAKAIDLLKIFGLEGLAETEAANLPYGAQRKLEIARALATGMKLLLLDEPAAGMNPTETEDLLNCINTIRDRFGIAILLIEHDMSLVMNVCQRIQVLDYGRTIAAGTPEEIANNPQVISAYLGSDDDTDSDDAKHESEEA